jgi:hypothetical protein
MYINFEKFPRVAKFKYPEEWVLCYLIINTIVKLQVLKTSILKIQERTTNIKETHSVVTMTSVAIREKATIRGYAVSGRGTGVDGRLRLIECVSLSLSLSSSNEGKSLGMISGCSCSPCDVLALVEGSVDHITVESECGALFDDLLILVTNLR